MAKIAPSLPKFRHLAELVEHFGGIPLERICWRPLPGAGTIADVIALDVHEDRLCELVDGVLIEKPPGFMESVIATRIVTTLYNFISGRHEGVVTGAGGPFELRPGLILVPDAAFTAWNRFPNRRARQPFAPQVAPNLAVEVLSPGNTPGEMARKLKEYFAAGVSLVWLVDPPTQSVAVYTTPTRSRIVPLDGKLTGGKVLPGLAIPVAQIFASLKRPKES